VQRNLPGRDFDAALPGYAKHRVGADRERVERRFDELGLGRNDRQSVRPARGDRGFEEFVVVRKLGFHGRSLLS
jgi:hypothetical protein